MKKSLLLTLLTALAALNLHAKDVTVTINLNTPGAASYAIGWGETTLLTAATTTFTTDNEESWGGTKSVVIYPADGFAITKVSYTDAENAEPVEVSETYTGSGYSVALNSDVIINVAAANLDDLRTNSCTVNVDDAAKVSLSRNGSTVALQNGANTVKFADNERNFSISAVYGSKINEVKLNGNAVSDPYGSGYYSVELQDKDVLDITANFPEGTRTFSIRCTDPAVQLSQLITYLSFDGEQQDIASYDFATPRELNIGTQINFSADQQKFNITAFKVNGVDQQFNGYFAINALRENTEIEIAATKNASETATMHIDHPDKLSVYMSQYAYGDALTPDAQGNVTLEWLAGQTPYFCFSTNGHVAIKSVKNGETEVQATEEYGSTYYQAEKDARYEVESEVMQPAGHAAVVCHDATKAIMNLSLASSGNIIEQYNINTTDGALTEIPIYDGDQSFNINLTTGGWDDVNQVWVNCTKADLNYGYCTLYITEDYGTKVKAGDIVRIYAATDNVQAEAVSINFDQASAAEAFSAKIDGYQDIDLTDPIADGDWQTNPFQAPTLAKICLYLPEGANAADYEVKAGDTALSYNAEKACYEATAATGLVVAVSKTATGISSVSADRAADQRVYNLQGARVDADNMPAGIYIVNGHKVVRK